ncbi:hypothetical protein BH24ACT10_BH24ACT10_11280 [soil metagenome]
MQIDKSQILELLRSQGKQDQVSEADSQLPDKVDPERDSGLLQRFGLDPQMILGLISKGGGGGSLGGLGKMLGG